LNGCGRRAVNTDSAREILAAAPPGILEKDDLNVISVLQVSPGQAVVETQLRTAFRLEKVGNEWVIREVRVGHGQWEKLESILAAHLQAKTEQTRRFLETVGAAIDAYRLKNGSLPRFSVYVELSDALYPDFLSPLIREDAWSHPLSAYWAGPNAIRLVSAGPDGKEGTKDDMELLRSYNPGQER
jgi:hypothetical protein